MNVLSLMIYQKITQFILQYWNLEFSKDHNSTTIFIYSVCQRVAGTGTFHRLICS